MKIGVVVKIDICLIAEGAHFEISFRVNKGSIIFLTNTVWHVSFGILF